MSTVVVLPAPLGPRKATISPGRTVRSTSSTATTVVPSVDRKDLRRPVARMAGTSRVTHAPSLSAYGARVPSPECHDLRRDTCHPAAHR